MENKNFNWRPMSEYTGGRVLATNGLDVLIGEINSDGDCESEENGSTVLCGITGFIKIEEILPELKESSDERIRKEIIDFIYDKTDTYELREKSNSWLAWLEKQGEKSTDKVEPKFKVGDWVVYHRNDSSTEIMNVYDIRDNRYYFNDNIHFSWSVKECDEKCHLWTIQDAKNGDVLAAEPIEEYHSPFVAIYKKQNEEDFDSYCFIGFDGKFCKGENGHSTEGVHPAAKEQRDLLFQKMHDARYEWDTKKKELKKIEQKSTDKIEPKFRDGDWVIDDDENVFHITIDNNKYQLETVEGKLSHCSYEIIERKFRLWTIQDAKDGDVLFQDLMGGKTFIYNGIGPNMEILYSFIISNDGEDVLPYHIGKPNTGIGNIEDNKNIIYPATKEQYGLLFQKMHDAGYEMDAEKKDLRKIKEEVNGEDYGIDSLYHAQKILEKTLGKVDDYQSDDGILEHKCAISAVKKLYKQKSAWSEEDERIYKSITYSFANNYPLTVQQQEFVKSFKDRYTWKPSKEQIRRLEYFLKLWGKTEDTENTKVFETVKSLLKDLKQL